MWSLVYIERDADVSSGAVQTHTPKQLRVGQSLFFHVCACMCVCVHACMCSCVHACKCVCVCVHVYIYIVQRDSNSCVTELG